MKHLRSSADIRAHLRFIPFFLVASCHQPSPGPLTEAIYCPPGTYHETTRYIWQRTYPEEWRKLVPMVTPDPFADPADRLHPNDVDPASAGLISGWQRRLVPRALEKLGHPVSQEGGTDAIVATDGQSIVITHTPEAIRAFDQKFPEIAANKLTDPQEIAAARSAPTWQEWKAKYPNYGDLTPHIRFAKTTFTNLDLVLPGFELQAADLHDAVEALISAHKAAHPQGQSWGIMVHDDARPDATITLPKSNITLGDALDAICRQSGQVWEIPPSGKIIIRRPT